jgi:hypothetical protein
MEPGTQDLGFSSHGGGGAKAGEQMKEKASQLTHTARERAMSTLDGQKEQLCGLLERVADTMADDRLGGYGADYARRGAQYLRRTSSREIVASVRDGLRARPGVLLSACFVAGLAVARLMRGAAEDGDRWRGEDAWRGGEGWRGDEGGWSEAGAWPERRGVDEASP